MMTRWSKNVLTAVVTAAALAPQASAYLPEGTVDRVGALYKSIRTIMPSVAGEDLGNGEDRHLSELLTTRCFIECIEQNLSPEDCQLLIEDLIGQAGGHEVGPVTVKIQVPRTPVVFGSSYWMVEVPVNINGQFTCDRNEGETFYPFLWSGDSGDIAVQNILCQGMSAGECCAAVRAYGQASLGGQDVNGNCLACFAHQEPLVPVVNTINGLTEYRDYVFNDPICEQMQLTGPEIASADAATQSKIDVAVQTLSTWADAPTCFGFTQLLADLYDAATVIKPLSIAVGELACNYCYGPNDLDVTALSATDSLIQYLLTLLNTPAPSSAENCIIIYTNDDGTIVDIPKLGGSRADDPYDDDCPEDSSEPGENNCPNGYSTAGGICAPCPEGTYEEGGVCLPCEPGTFSGEGVSVCTPCASRTIAASPGSAVCAPCPEGHEEVGNTKCEICPAGTCQRDDLNECVPCFAGLYQPDPGQSFCLQCPLGKVQPLTGQVECEACAFNFVAPKRGLTQCTECPEGTKEGSRQTCVADLP